MKHDICNLERINSMDQAHLRDLLAISDKAIPDYIQTINTAITTQDSHLAHQYAHKLAGASATIGAELLSKTAQEIEKRLIRNDDIAGAEIKELANSLQLSFENFKVQIQIYV